MRDLPSGVVTFLFTDIEGSTRLLREHGTDYASLLGEHRRMVRTAIGRHDGVEVDTQGDAFFVAFGRADDAVVAAEEIVRAEGPIRVRIGIHTGEPMVTHEGYVGLDVHRAARICAAAHGGQVVMSEATRLGLPSDPGRDLGMHRLKDLGAPERLFQLGTDEFPPLRSLNATNLPAQPDTLVGRSEDLDEVARRIDAARIVTLTGPGGTGKTRLALQAAAESIDRFEGGVFLVPLAAIGDPNLIEWAIGQTIGAQLGLSDHIGEKRMLLLLDNFEQLLPQAARPMADLVAACPNLRLLITSRAPLRIAGENEYAVSPLPAADAVELFLERAFVTRPVEPVHEICRRLDGLPLAIELAAARTRILPPDQLLARLDHSLPVLVGGRRDAPERHQTLRATIAWSYDLLSPVERRLFDRLGVFVGGFTLMSAERICEADLETVESLVEQSLVRRTEDGRFGMLATILEFAVGLFEQAADSFARRQRHAAFHADWAEKSAELLRRTGDSSARVAFGAEMPNLRAAHGFALSQGDALLALRLATAMAVYGRRSSGGLREHVERLARDLGMGTVAARARCEGLNALVWLAFEISADPADVEAASAEALELARQIGSPLLLARSLIARATVARPADAVELFEEAATTAMSDDLPWEAASAYNNAADLLARLGRLGEARDLCAKAMVVSRGSGDRFGQSLALMNAGEIDVNLGRLDAAMDELTEAVYGFQDAASGTHLAHSMSVLAAAESLAGRRTTAYRHLAESAAILVDVDASGPVVEFLGDAATVLVHEHPLTAAHVLGAVRHAEERVGKMIGQPLLEKVAASAIASLGATRFDHELQIGMDAELSDVFDDVRSILDDEQVV